MGGAHGRLAAMTASGGLLVFTRDGDLLVFPSQRQAAGYIEAIDVENGEYPAAFKPDGCRVQITTSGDDVVFSAATADAEGLRGQLEIYLARPLRETDDPCEIANTWLRDEWAASWPRRPSWLHRVVHGAEPPTV
jgi:hypothetical protein